MNRIACGVVVSLLLMLWPVAPAVAEEEAPQMIALLEEFYVYPDRAEDFTTYMKEAKEVAAVHGFPYRWDFYALDDLRYLAITWVDGIAGIGEMQAAWAEVMEKWGEEAAAAWAAGSSGTISHSSSSVWKPRPDLSYMPANPADELAYIVWGLLAIKPGHQDEVEALFRKYLAAFAERKVPYGWRTAEIMIGSGYPTLAFVDWAASPGSYWMRHDEEEKDEVLGAKSTEIWHKMMPHIRGFDYVTGHYLKELSYHPEKVEEN